MGLCGGYPSVKLRDCAERFCRLRIAERLRRLQRDLPRRRFAIFVRDICTSSSAPTVGIGANARFPAVALFIGGVPDPTSRRITLRMRRMRDQHHSCESISVGGALMQRFMIKKHDVE